MVRRFLIVWLAQFTSIVGTALSGYSLTVWLASDRFPTSQEHAKLAASLAALNAVAVICTLIFLPIAGYLTDYINRFFMMFIANTGSFLCSISIFIFFVYNSTNLVLIFSLIAILYISSTFHISSFDVSYFMFVPPKHRGRAAALLQLANYAKDVAAPPLALMIISMRWHSNLIQCSFNDCARPISGYAVISLIDSLTYLVAAIVMITCQIRYANSRSTANFFDGLLHGSRFIKGNRTAIKLITSFVFANLAAGAASVLEILALKSRYSGEFGKYLVFFAFSGAIGGIMSVILLGVLGGSTKHGYPLILLAMAGTGIGYCLFRVDNISGFILANLITSFSVPIMNAHSQAIWLALVPREEQGRVFSIRRMIAQSSIPIGACIGGFVGAYKNVTGALSIIGIALFTVSAVQIYRHFNTRICITIPPT